MGNFIPYEFKRTSEADMHAAAAEYFRLMNGRRSIREFSSEPVSRKLIETAIRTASTAPSGAHRQPWSFVAISDAEIKRQIRVAAEKEEHESYAGGRMPDSWLAALEPFGTDWRKPFLETVPWIVVVFEHTYGLTADGQKQTNYYVKESVGIACGLFIAALHQMGLATLTHTPSPMAFLSEILGRTKNERPFILFPVGFPADGVTVPDIQRKTLEEVSVWFT